ncbi:MAG: TIGR00282 family metallophosphoesterase [Kiloniellales bacterium]|nr:TIGR00282 family metallophosphoesterase [Kiloniellales bacterium]
MRLLFLGDLVGRAGREAVIARLSSLRRELKADLVVVNGENAAAGLGITRKICDEVFDAGADVITGGNHIWDQKETIGFISQEPRLLRPLNYPEGTPGFGAGVFNASNGARVLVMSVMGQLFMEDLNDPFAAVEQVLAKHRMGATVDAIVLDVHAETTAEKQAVGHAFDGRITICVGTHTHVPTADVMILPGGTAYQSDAGMCGDYDSVIGWQKTIATEKFRRKVRGERNIPADGEATICGLLVECDGKGKALRAAALRLGGRLAETFPEF